MRPGAQYIALHTVNVNGVPGYREGDDMTADVVEKLGLVIGVDVKPANADVVPRPAGNAKRTEWEAYAIGQGLTPDEVAEMTVSDIRNRYPVTEPDGTVTDVDLVTEPASNQLAAPPRNGSKADWVTYVVAAGHDITADQANELTRDELANTYGPKADAE